MNIRVLPGWVLLEEIKDEDVTASGIKLPESSQDVPMKGRVLSKGEGVEVEQINNPPGRPQQVVYRELGVNLGDTVLYKKYAGQTIKHEGKEYKLVEFKDLLAIIE